MGPGKRTTSGHNQLSPSHVLSLPTLLLWSGVKILPTHKNLSWLFGGVLREVNKRNRVMEIPIVPRNVERERGGCRGGCGGRGL